MRALAVAMTGALVIAAAAPALAAGRPGSGVRTAETRRGPLRTETLQGRPEARKGTGVRTAARRDPGTGTARRDPGTGTAWRNPGVRTAAWRSPGVRTAARRHGWSAVFNVPSGTPAQQNAIARHIGALVAGAPRGSLIRIAVYHITSPSFTRSLLRAHGRGARVRLVVDASARRTAAYRRLAHALGTDRARPSWITACAHGCAGDGIMHNKFFLFSRTGTGRDVVVQSSANMTTTNRVNAWNNAVTIRGRRLYRAYGRYFDALARHRPGRRAVRAGDVTSYTFPAARGDVLAGLLGHVGCAHGTQVRVTTFALTRARVARRLWSLAHRGCDVRIVYTNLGARARRILTRHGGPRLLSSHYRYLDPRGVRRVEAFAHSKYVLVCGTYRGRVRRLVITGSPNYTRPGLRDNDEAMLVLPDDDVYAAYADNFADLWTTASTSPRLTGRVPDPM